MLSEKIEKRILERLYRSYDIVGKIAIIRIPKQLEEYSDLIAKAIMEIHREVKSIWKQSSSISGDYRLRNLEFIAGEKTTQTRYKEHGCIYKTDLRKVYFSPRLSFERYRIAKLVQKDEVILNMFSGVGCFSIAIAKHAKPKKIYSIDINPIAHKYQLENIRLNRVDSKISVIQEDARVVIERKMNNFADRVLIPLPEKAYDYLEYAISALKSQGGRIHYYDFHYAKKKKYLLQRVGSKVLKKIQPFCKEVHIECGRFVRSVGPRWYQIVLDIDVHKE